MTTNTDFAFDKASKRLTTLSVSILVAACAGTNYVFSAYGPQLASQLHIEQTSLNLIGLAGNVGVYSSSPIWGRIVDARGPRIPLAGAFILLFFGYSGIRTIYNAGPPETNEPISSPVFYALVLFSYLTGAGGCAALNGAGNPTTKSFPDQMRATVTGLVFSGFGLSAFIFSAIAHAAFPGDTSSFLLVLAIGTACPMLIGYFFIKVIPLQEATKDHDPQTPLLSGHVPPTITSDVLLVDAEPNVSGWGLCRNGDFWGLFLLFSIFAGTGLMFINNIGTMARILYAHENASFNPVIAAQWQATQVSILSIMNCSGRVVIGLLSDFISTRLMRPRSYCYVLAASVVLLSQLVAANIDSVANLWIATGLLGIGYGGAAAISPIVAIEYFGLSHFSEACGYIALSPLILGNVFSVAFGRNLDAHGKPGSAMHNFDDSAPKCTQGRLCYVNSLYMTAAASFIGVGVITWMARRDRKKALASRRRQEEAAVWGIYID
ncbi:MFS general substrate transporter [Pleurotus eryngii]|uniref:MFS general substrate transporter n=1 Tax=Pleurotus eryngii TaxID=5323 RepID=A0A9P6DC13_PLEER|nr:MFS general substrate transporter [Pleurotus eryngii]